ncbi:LysE family translocator [Gulosibacter faecalis]|uniref:LysE family translocator n=1 Tax=Gulosibacter faecalis TaxID=272240 RepID=A0ABW5V085_9MICO|nr:LysE family translocator [Gulosibacter faecalis]
MDGSLVIAFWGVSAMFILLPGADWAYILASGSRRGGATPAIGGMMTGHLVVIVGVAAGIAAVVAAFPLALTALSVAGGGYLVYLGVSSLRSGADTNPDVKDVSVNPGGLYARGVGVSLLNPKVFLLLLALLPQFTTPNGSVPLSLQLLALGGVHLVTCTVVYLLLGFGAGIVLERRPGTARIVRLVSGGIMILIGALVIGEQVVEHLR